MSNDPREQALQKAHEIVSEHFPHVVIVVEAVFQSETGEPACSQMLRWYGDSTAATGLMVYVSDLITRKFSTKQVNPPAAPVPLQPQQEEALAKAQQILSEQFSTLLIVAQGEGELTKQGERSLKVLRCVGGQSTLAGLSMFGSNALRKMALGVE
ncbi:MAG: hypothetical protein WCP06_00455 [Verrucomicrobiota bacterium]